jgi:hypothetical protein
MPAALLGACSGRAAGGLFGSMWVNPQGRARVSVEFKKKLEIFWSKRKHIACNLLPRRFGVLFKT